MDIQETTSRKSHVPSTVKPDIEIGADFNHRAWNPDEYAAIYYPRDRIGEENEALIRHIVHVWRKIADQKIVAACHALAASRAPCVDLTILGGGGMLWDAPAAAPHVKCIRYTDPFERSRRMVSKYIKEPNDYWDAYVAHTLREEGFPEVSTKMVRERVNLLRCRLRRIESCNVFERQPVTSAPLHSAVVAAHFVLDSITRRRDVWRTLMHNTASCVAPGGCLLLSALGRAREWRSSTTDDTPQPAVYLTQEDFWEVLGELGFGLFHLAWIPAAEQNVREYEGLIVCAARRMAPRSQRF